MSEYCAVAMSGTSTPRGDRSPPPPEGAAAGPSPLTIGKRFVKQYYQTLMTTPDQIHRFYQPTSVLSDGEGSSPTDPVTFEDVYAGSNADKLKDRFFVKDLQIRFEFEHGAIDAQQSVNGGLLLVVTGHVVYYPSASEDEDAAVDDPIRKGFVHNFFLNVNTVGTKKSFYVHNDILRFLKNPSEVSAISTSSSSEAAPAVVSEPVAAAVVESTPVPEPAPKPVKAKKEKTTTTKSTPPPPAAASAPIAEDAPGSGVEETKDDLPTPDPVTKSAKEDKASKKAAPASNAKKEADGRAKSPKRNTNNCHIKCAINL